MRSRLFMRRGILVFVFAALVTVGVGAPVLAASLVRTSEGTASIPAGQVVDGSAFLAGDSVTVDGTVLGDLYCAGNSVLINGTVEGDVLCAGDSVTVAGVVGGNIRVAGNTVVLKGSVAKSALVAAYSLVTDSAFTLGNDMLVGANTVLFSGTIGRDARVGASTLEISGSVKRNVDAAVETLTISSGALVGGDLKYISDRDGTVADGTVSGTVNREASPVRDTSFTPQDALGAYIKLLLIATVLWMVLALFVTLVVPRYVHFATAPYSHIADFLKAAVVGLAAMFVILPLTLISFVSGIGVLLGFFMVCAYTIALLLAPILVAYRVGLFMLGGRNTNIFFGVVLGVATLAVLSAVPFVGLLVVFATMSVGLGMVILSFRSQYVPHGYNTVKELTVPVKPAKTAKK